MTKMNLLQSERYNDKFLSGVLKQNSPPIKAVAKLIWEKMCADFQNVCLAS